MNKTSVVVALIIGVSLMVSAAIFRGDMHFGKKAPRPQKGTYELLGYEGAVYKINTQTGQTKVLVPADNAVGFVDLSDINFENLDAMKENMKSISQYLRNERARSLAAKGLKEALQQAGEKSPA